MICARKRPICAKACLFCRSNQWISEQNGPAFAVVLVREMMNFDRIFMARYFATKLNFGIAQPSLK